MFNINLKESTIYNFPHTFIGKKNEPVIIKPLDEKMHRQLMDMYLTRVPRNSFGGLPPIRDEVCIKWIQGMIDTGINLVALSFEAGIVGHGAIFPMNETMCELLLVIPPKYQHSGIGTQLTRCIIQLAYELCFERIWLYGEMKDQTAKHVYKKCGFEYLSPDRITEVEMIFDLRRYQKTMNVKVKQIMSKNVVTLSRDRSCLDALDIFIKYNFGALPIVDGGNHVIGILTETDLIVETNLNLKVGDIQTMEVVTVHEDAQIEKVIRLFQSKNLRCVPVVNSKMKLVGIVGRKDILSYYFLKFRLGLDFKDA
ncbi:MAG: GNAT family N-acetyltransferase [Proteobacteria bacterium]|nr:GNAT family N-acetyltransferase [Pseudomonadota bacterium]